MNFSAQGFLRAILLVALGAFGAGRTMAQTRTSLDTGFHRMYELNFDAARAQFTAYQQAHPDDPLGDAAFAASYLFEELDNKGVFTSEFFLDDKKLLGGVKGPPDEPRRVAFFASNATARKKAQQILKLNSRDANALFVLTLADGMEADYDAIIARKQLASLHFIREAENSSTKLLAIQPDLQDAYVALGAANYIIGCLPAYKRGFLWLGGIHGDRQRGMNQLQQAALHGRYLQPFAKVMLALAALREKQPELARLLLADLAREFPENPRFAHELAVAEQKAARQ